jgi:hypothetical protein
MMGSLYQEGRYPKGKKMGRAFMHRPSFQEAGEKKEFQHLITH